MTNGNVGSRKTGGKATVSPQQRKNYWGIGALILVIFFYGAVRTAADAKQKPKKRASAPTTVSVAETPPKR